MPETKRKYVLKDRARTQQQTRARIVDALIHLHETVGASRATVAEVARIAGINRMTVYKHFATEADMVAACTSHWIELHPPPDVATWSSIPDPGVRLRTALAELYGYYRETQAMWSTAYRDAPLVESLGRIMDETWFALLDRAVGVLANGWGARGRRRTRLVGALKVSVDFPTWRTLTRAGLSEAEAVEAGAGFVESAARAM